MSVAKKKKIQNPKQFQRITVTIEPKAFLRGYTEIRAEVKADGRVFNAVEIVEIDHFTSFFDYSWKRIKYHLDQILKHDGYV